MLFRVPFQVLATTKDAELEMAIEKVAVTVVAVVVLTVTAVMALS